MHSHISIPKHASRLGFPLWDTLPFWDFYPKMIYSIRISDPEINILL